MSESYKIYDENIFPECPNVYYDEQLEDDKLSQDYRDFIKTFETLKQLKSENIAYREAVEKMIYWFYTGYHNNSIFPENYSHEHAAGILEGLSMFCFPENQLKFFKEIIKRTHGDGEHGE